MKSQLFILLMSIIFFNSLNAMVQTQLKESSAKNDIQDMLHYQGSLTRIHFLTKQIKDLENKKHVEVTLLNLAILEEEKKCKIYDLKQLLKVAHKNINAEFFTDLLVRSLENGTYRKGEIVPCGVGCAGLYVLSTLEKAYSYLEYKSIEKTLADLEQIYDSIKSLKMGELYNLANIAQLKSAILEEEKRSKILELKEQFKLSSCRINTDIFIGCYCNACDRHSDKLQIISLCLKIFKEDYSVAAYDKIEKIVKEILHINDDMEYWRTFDEKLNKQPKTSYSSQPRELPRVIEDLEAELDADIERILYIKSFEDLLKLSNIKLESQTFDRLVVDPVYLEELKKSCHCLIYEEIKKIVDKIKKVDDQRKK